MNGRKRKPSGRRCDNAARRVFENNLYYGGVLIPGKNPAATASAAGDAVSLTTAADIVVNCCAVPANISVQIDVAGTVNSATLVVTKMA